MIEVQKKIIGRLIAEDIPFKIDKAENGEMAIHGVKGFFYYGHCWSISEHNFWYMFPDGFSGSECLTNNVDRMISIIKDLENVLKLEKP